MSGGLTPGPQNSSRGDALLVPLQSWAFLECHSPGGPAPGGLTKACETVPDTSVTMLTYRWTHLGNYPGSIHRFPMRYKYAAHMTMTSANPHCARR